MSHLPHILLHRQYECELELEACNVTKIIWNARNQIEKCSRRSLEFPWYQICSLSYVAFWNCSSIYSSLFSSTKKHSPCDIYRKVFQFALLTIRLHRSQPKLHFSLSWWRHLKFFYTHWRTCSWTLRNAKPIKSKPEWCVKLHHRRWKVYHTPFLQPKIWGWTITEPRIHHSSCMSNTRQSIFDTLIDWKVSAVAEIEQSCMQQRIDTERGDPDTGT